MRGFPALVCLVVFAALGSVQAGAAAPRPVVPPVAGQPVTAWAASVHIALAKQARDTRLAAAHHKIIQTGLASWYGRDFAGHKTSSGTRFDPMKLTAAHRTLPLGTRLLVTSRTTGRSVVVTVNDRGPFAGPSRIIDLSRAAAARLGMVQDGLNRVTLQRVAPPAGAASDHEVEVAQAASADDSTQAVAVAAKASDR